MEHIRKANMDDIWRIAEIAVFTKRTAYLDIFKDVKATYQVLQVASTVQQILEAGTICDMFVYDDGIIKGFMHRRLSKNNRKPNELCELYVEPIFQKEGIGSKFLTCLLMECRSNSVNQTIELWVLCENNNARQFYAGKGFRETSEDRIVEGTDDVKEMKYIFAL